VAATGFRALASGVGSTEILLGVVLPILVVAAITLLRHRTAKTPATAVRHFTLRTTSGESVPYSLRDGQPIDALRTGDLVRVVPGRRGTARAIEVLVGLNGPVVRRLENRLTPALPEWAGFAAAAALVTTGVAVLLGAL